MKRLFDLFFSTLLLILLLPALLVIFFVVYIKLGTPVLFCQQRPGLRGKPFFMYKFRTMTNERDAQGNHLPDDQRMTSFGRSLRSSSLDELPELWNILKGEMSFVGPRPLLTEYLPLYSQEQSRRHDVLPGITGWAQINGRNAISWDDKLAYDVWYVDNQSFLLDLKILFLTVKTVLGRQGIAQEGTETAHKFTGSSDE